MERELILDKLLDKYENSKHMLQPGVSRRRVMLQVDRKELPAYDYESAEVRDRFNAAARVLEREGLIQVQWLPARPVISLLSLNLDKVDEAYRAAGRLHPAMAAADICALIRGGLARAKAGWIQDWRDHACRSIGQTLRIPAFLRQGPANASAFVSLLANYDGLDGEATTLRALSIGCFQDSKRFEREFQGEFLRAASRFHPTLAEQCAQDDLSDREALEILGIYAHPELFQLSGHCSLVTETGEVDLSPLFPHGAALPSPAAGEVLSLRMPKVKRAVFIENFTNYHEYLRTEALPSDLVIFHGGFVGPRKRAWFGKLSASLPPGAEARLWADIDLGGFRMFARLQELFPQLEPMRMSAEDVARHAALGFPREAPYLQRLSSALERREFPLFEDSIRAILQFGVTIEQEAFYIDAER